MRPYILRQVLSLNKIYVVGMGNILYTDDGAGVYCVREIKRRGMLPSNVTVIEAGTDPDTALYEVENNGYLVVADAVFADKQPGEILKIPLSEVGQNINIFSMHGIDFMYMLRQAGLNISGVVIGIQPEAIAPGIGLTDIIDKRLSDLASAVEMHINGVYYKNHA